MDVQTLRMLVWWIAGGKCPEWWRLLGFSAFLGFSSYCQYTDCTILLGSTHHQSSGGGGSSNLKKPNTPMSKFACQAELQESSPRRLLSTRWKWDKTATSDETFLFPDPDSQFANHQPSVFNVTDLISWWVNFIALCIGVSSTGALAIIMWEERLVWLGANTARPPAVLTPT